MDKKDEEKKTWYAMNKQQVKLIQWLLYHLRKHKTNPEAKSIITKTEGDFLIDFK